jgi:hypothetical protein
LKIAKIGYGILLKHLQIPEILKMKLLWEVWEKSIISTFNSKKI